MKPDQLFLRAPVHTEMRMQLVLPCTLYFPELEMSAETFNVSYRGLGVNLAPGDQGFAWNTLRSINVQDIGDFDVIVRWRRGGRVGLKFCSKVTARPVLNSYFHQSGNYPV